jgi:hypothetical protein
MAKDVYVVRATRTFTTATTTYEAGEVYSIWGQKAKEARQYIKQGLLEEVDLDALEAEDDGAGEVVAFPTGPAWVDAELGTFHLGDLGWGARMPLPAFDAFRRGAKGPSKSKAAKSERLYPLVVVADAGRESPPADAIALVRTLVANQAALAARVAESLWADFAGTAPESGMYWHGDLDQVAEGLGSRRPPRGAKDLFSHMSLSHVCVREADQSRRYAAELNFAVTFEEGHGVGILTDGVDITGIGYSDDVSPFRSRG